MSCWGFFACGCTAGVSLLVVALLGFLCLWLHHLSFSLGRQNATMSFSFPPPFRGRRHGRQLRALAPCPCRRPSVGNVACRPSRRPARAHLGVTKVDVIYGVLCAWRSKTSCFTVFRAPRRSGISSWRYQKTMRFTWFWRSGGGPGREKMTC